MRSSHADYFNHDDGAVGYDDDVLNESDPIRTGYDAALGWVIENSGISRESRVLELGSGTGNLTSRLPEYHETICVDVSEKMEELALAKGARFPNRKFIKDDVLAVFDRNLGCFDSIVSTYTLHHLTEPQKVTLFGKLWSALNDGGVAVIGDLMVESADQLANKGMRYRNESWPRKRAPAKRKRQLKPPPQHPTKWIDDSQLKNLKLIGSGSSSAMKLNG